MPWFGVALIAAVAAAILPLPPTLIGVLMAANIAAALSVLVLAAGAGRPAEFPSFPALLLGLTLFRVALNVASARAILLHGYAGEVVERFGEFVMGGNPVVGFAAFLILAAVQFLVITRGAERISEVAARFALDALPGKQMSIDADLGAGLISQEEAARRREELQREADFYGAMDGASRFVKGDAVAALVILAVILLGGFAVGTLQQGLSPAEALHRYALLTVGDGLAHQVPALLLSTAAGILVSRAAARGPLERSVLDTLRSQPRAVALAAVAMATLGAVPGMPAVPFLLAAAVAGTGWALLARQGSREKSERAAAVPPPDDPAPVARVDALAVELGPGLEPWVEALPPRVALLRRSLAESLGLPLPPVRLRLAPGLRPGEYRILLRGVAVAEGHVRPGRVMVLETPGIGSGSMPAGEPGKDPVFGVPVVWADPDAARAAQAAGHAAVDPETVLLTHLERVSRTYARELLGREDVQRLLEAWRERAPSLAQEVVASAGVGTIHKLCMALLSEGIPIVEFDRILEAASDTRGMPWHEVVAECRRRLAASITRMLPRLEGKVAVIRVGTELDRRLADLGPDGYPDPQLAERVAPQVRDAVLRAAERGLSPIAFACSSAARPAMARLLALLGVKDAVAVAWQEILPGVPLEAVAHVEVNG